MFKNCKIPLEKNLFFFKRQNHSKFSTNMSYKQTETIIHHSRLSLKVTKAIFLMLVVWNKPMYACTYTYDYTHVRKYEHKSSAYLETLEANIRSRKKYTTQKDCRLTSRIRSYLIWNKCNKHSGLTHSFCYIFEKTLSLHKIFWKYFWQMQMVSFEKRNILNNSTNLF